MESSADEMRAKSATPDSLTSICFKPAISGHQSPITRCSLDTYAIPSYPHFGHFPKPRPAHLGVIRVPHDKIDVALRNPAPENLLGFDGIERHAMVAFVLVHGGSYSQDW
jgi:hypothetical protein